MSNKNALMRLQVHFKDKLVILEQDWGTIWYEDGYVYSTVFYGKQAGPTTQWINRMYKDFIESP